MKHQNSKEYFILIVLLMQCSIATVSSHPAGAPTSACETMDPSIGHGSTAQTGQSPYTLEVLNDVTTYTPGSAVQGKRSSCGGSTEL